MFKNFWRERQIILLGVLILLVICGVHAVQAGNYVDFAPTNGTFQNFNPVRRLLSGQIPYKDFQDYLGLGHLYTGAVFTVLCGGDYRASLIAFSFLTIFSFTMLLIVIGSSVSVKRSVVIEITGIIMIMLFMRPLLFINMLVGTEEMDGALSAALGPGNSARFVRGLILPITCVLIVLGHKLCESDRIMKLAAGRRQKYSILGLLGCIAGFAFPWSNDYGISCWLCLHVMLALILLAKTGRPVKALILLLYTLLISLISIFVFVEIFTAGHFKEWFRSIFGIGGWQGWYYNSPKSYYLFDVDFSFVMLLQGILCVIYLLKIWKTKAVKDSVIRYGIPAFANMTGFCAVNEYRMLSGGDAREVALTVLFATLLFEIYRYISNWKMEKFIRTAAFAVSLAWIVSAVKEEFIFLGGGGYNRKGEYVAELGGNMTLYGSDLLRTNGFLNGDKFFATYASAQEVVSDIFQPSGTDYIIHVLGDDQREKYLQCFREGDFRYAATVKEEATLWEYWIRRGNWFFYRELYREWHPVYANTYEMYWERNKGINHIATGACSVEVQEIDNATRKIIVRADAQINGIADVYIDYEVKKNDGKMSRLLFQSMLSVVNSGTVFSSNPGYETNYLRPVGAEFIPVTVADGYGEVTITASPVESTELVLHEAVCSDIYQVIFDYVECNDIFDRDTGIVFRVSNTDRNRMALGGAAGIGIQGYEYPVSEISSDEQYIYILCARNGADFAADLDIHNYSNILYITLRNGGNHDGNL